MSDTESEQRGRFRYLWTGGFCSLIGGIAGFVLAGWLQADVLAGVLLGASVGFLLGWLLGPDGITLFFG